MEKFIILVVCLLGVMVLMGSGQEQHLRASGPWRQRFQWETNGRVYSLLSTGTQYRSPAQNRKRTQMLLTARNSRNTSGSLRSRARLEQQNEQMDTSVLGPEAGQYLLSSGQQASHNHSTVRHLQESTRTTQEFSGSGVPRGGRSTTGDDTGVQQATVLLDSRIRPTYGQTTRSQQTGLPEDAQSLHRAQSLTRVTAETNVSHTPLSSNAVEIHFPRITLERQSETDTGDPGEDPQNSQHRNSVFYNAYPPNSRNRPPARPPSGTGYGTRFFHRGDRTLQK